MNLSELENMSFLTNEAIKDIPIDFDYDDEGDLSATIKFQDAVTLFEKGYKYRDKEIEKLKQENKKLKDALGFYADIDNYKWSYQDFEDDTRIQHFELLDDFELFDTNKYAGKLARLTLKEIEESKN